jgi:hypothetical protein
VTPFLAAGMFKSVQVITNSFITGKPNTLIFKLVPQHIWVLNGYLLIDFPN